MIKLGLCYMDERTTPIADSVLKLNINIFVDLSYLQQYIFS